MDTLLRWGTEVEGPLGVEACTYTCLTGLRNRRSTSVPCWRGQVIKRCVDKNQYNVYISQPISVTHYQSRVYDLCGVKKSTIHIVLSLNFTFLCKTTH